MLPPDVTERRVLDWSGREVGRVVGLSVADAGWLFVRLDEGIRERHSAPGRVVAVHVDEVSAMRPGEVCLRVSLPMLLRAAGAR